jgi:transglutaminase-like putative cysteine protease
MHASLRFASVLVLLSWALGTGPWHAMAADPSADEKSRAERAVRTFRFDYGATLTGLKAGEEVRVWLPVPPSNDEQQVEIVAQELPAEATLGTEMKYGNQMLSFAMKAPEGGSLPMRVSFRVERREVRAIAEEGGEPISEEEREQFLKPDALVPIKGKPLALIEQLALANDPLALGRQLYDRVGEHMAYSKEGTGWGQGDVLWACGSRYGNCTDFHSLFISLARARGLPSRFEMGFPLPPERGQGKIAGYHCWAWFYADERGWMPVDISEADKHPEMTEYYFGNLTPDRVAFTTGRDLVLDPPQQGPALNYFIYPYAEVEGEPVERKAFQLEFAYEDL